MQMRLISQRTLLAGGLALALGLVLVPTKARGEEVPKAYRECSQNGLDWSAKTQFKDGHWEGTGGQYAVSATARAATALLCEGSTIREGKYRDNIKRAVNWIMERQQANGL